MTILYWCIAAVVCAILIWNWGLMSEDHKRDLRLAREAEMYRRMQAAMPGIVAAFQKMTVTVQGASEEMDRFAADFRKLYAAESYAQKVKRCGGD